MSLQEVPDEIRRLMKKRVDELSEEEKRILREFYLSSRPRRARTLDERKAARVPARVATWLRKPGRYDIPGIDTPQEEAEEAPRSTASTGEAGREKAETRTTAPKARPRIDPEMLEHIKNVAKRSLEMLESDTILSLRDRVQARHKEMVEEAIRRIEENPGEFLNYGPLDFHKFAAEIYLPVAYEEYKKLVREYLDKIREYQETLEKEGVLNALRELVPDRFERLEKAEKIVKSTLSKKPSLKWFQKEKGMAPVSESLQPYLFDLELAIDTFKRIVENLDKVKPILEKYRRGEPLSIDEATVLGEVLDAGSSIAGKVKIIAEEYNVGIPDALRSEIQELIKKNWPTEVYIFTGDDGKPLLGFINASHTAAVLAELDEEGFDPRLRSLLRDGKAVKMPIEVINAALEKGGDIRFRVAGPRVEVLVDGEPVGAGELEKHSLGSLLGMLEKARTGWAAFEVPPHLVSLITGAEDVYLDGRGFIALNLSEVVLTEDHGDLYVERRGHPDESFASFSGEILKDAIPSARAIDALVTFRFKNEAPIIVEVPGKNARYTVFVAPRVDTRRIEEPPKIAYLGSLTRGMAKGLLEALKDASDRYGLARLTIQPDGDAVFHGMNGSRTLYVKLHDLFLEGENPLEPGEYVIRGILYQIPRLVKSYVDKTDRLQIIAYGSHYQVINGVYELEPLEEGSEEAEKDAEIISRLSEMASEIGPGNSVEIPLDTWFNRLEVEDGVARFYRNKKLVKEAPAPGVTPGYLDLYGFSEIVKKWARRGACQDAKIYIGKTKNLVKIECPRSGFILGTLTE